MRPERCTILVDGEPLETRVGFSLAAALANAGRFGLRRSLGGQLRGAVCGMGSCFECRVWVDGRGNQRACQLSCRPGMEVRLDD